MQWHHRQSEAINGFSKNFIQKISNVLEDNHLNCNCQAYSELDWIVDEDSVLRPDCMVVCGNFDADYLNFPPTLIVEISSIKTKLRDRNTKYELYEMQGVRFYILADTENKKVEAFELINGKYVPKHDTHFQLTDDCSIDFDVYNLWASM